MGGQLESFDLQTELPWWVRNSNSKAFSWLKGALDYHLREKPMLPLRCLSEHELEGSYIGVNRK